MAGIYNPSQSGYIQRFAGGSPGFNGMGAGAYGSSDSYVDLTPQHMKLQNDEAARQRDFQGQQSELSRQMQAHQNDLNRQAQMAPFEYRKSLLDRFLPGLLGGAGGFGGDISGGFSGGGYSDGPGGSLGGGGGGSGGSVYDKNQIQQQVNAAQASNDARLGTQTRELAQEQASRGYGSNSPAFQSLQQSLQMGNNAANATAAREIPFQAAQANSDAGFKGQQLGIQSFQAHSDAALRSQQIQQQSRIAQMQAQQAHFNSLLSLLGG